MGQRIQTVMVDGVIDDDESTEDSANIPLVKRRDVLMKWHAEWAKRERSRRRSDGFLELLDYYIHY
jgi:hypothetical protein